MLASEICVICVFFFLGGVCYCCFVWSSSFSLGFATKWQLWKVKTVHRQTCHTYMNAFQMAGKDDICLQEVYKEITLMSLSALVPLALPASKQCQGKESVKHYSPTQLSERQRCLIQDWVLRVWMPTGVHYLCCLSEHLLYRHRPAKRGVGRGFRQFCGDVLTNTRQNKTLVDYFPFLFLTWGCFLVCEHITFHH